MVCGDETQKPFPLLVWDLNNRKLQHDIRMAGHEYHMDVADVTSDGQYAVAACKVSTDSLNPQYIETGVTFELTLRRSPEHMLQTYC